MKQGIVFVCVCLWFVAKPTFQPKQIAIYSDDSRFSISVRIKFMERLGYRYFVSFIYISILNFILQFNSLQFNSIHFNSIHFISQFNRSEEQTFELQSLMIN